MYRMPFVAVRVLLCTFVAAATRVSAAPLDRPADPVVLTGAATPALIGAAPADVVAFRWTGAWQQIPVQVDERALVDLNQPYGSYTCSGNPYCFGLPSPGTLVLQYADAATLTGADPVATVDADDEIVFMAKDAGDQAPAASEPAGVVPGSGIEIHITDPLDGGEGRVYLFRQTGGLDPSAGQTYVSYDFELLSGPYLTTYQRNGGPNAEDSTVTSTFYARHFSDRWLGDGLAITAGAATGVDVLDRDKVMAFSCFRSEVTLNAGEGCFVANKSGPVRAIRSYMGANSGPHTQRQHFFYERREDMRTTVRVHDLPGGVALALDYGPAAAGMVYRNDNNPAGVTVDGVPDAVTAGPFTWETLDGGQGSLTALTSIDTDIPDFAFTSSYLDDAASGGGCGTGDGSTYGESGLSTTSLPSTDVAAGGSNSLAFTRITYFEAPGEADGPARRAQVDEPLEVTVIGGSTTTTIVSSTTTSTLVSGGDVPILGLKLIVVDKSVLAGKAKAVFVAKDAAISKGSGTNPAQIEAVLHVAYDATSGAFLMPQGGRWLVNSSSVAKYVNKAAPNGGAVKVSVIKPGSLVKVVGKSLGDTPLDIASPPVGPVYVSDVMINSGVETRLCTQFAGCAHKPIAGGTGYKLVCKGASVGDPGCSAAP